MKTIDVSSKAEYNKAIKSKGINKINMDFIDDLSDGEIINIRHEYGYEIWDNGEIKGCCCVSSPIYIVNEYTTLDNRQLYNFEISEV